MIDELTTHDLALIHSLVIVGHDQMFWGMSSRGKDLMIGYCVHCHAPTSGGKPHLENCEGQQRAKIGALIGREIDWRRLAAKVK